MSKSIQNLNDLYSNMYAVYKCINIYTKWLVELFVCVMNVTNRFVDLVVILLILIAISVNTHWVKYKIQTCKVQVIDRHTLNWHVACAVFVGSQWLAGFPHGNLYICTGICKQLSNIASVNNVVYIYIVYC